jgi:hypothetical protein
MGRTDPHPAFFGSEKLWHFIGIKGARAERGDWSQRDHFHSTEGEDQKP